ncbi:MAG: hypothetical protein KJ574_01390, partial [Nanoarchaeota archaeon]|nr:hypothetical protein [Nanoarchaeota archaeon]
MDEESKLKKYWERAMRKAYNEFKSEYEKDIADLNRRMPEGAKVSIETFPSLPTILELFREKMEHMRG